MDGNKRGFKAKTISKVIKDKVENWIKSITDESLREEIRSKVIVTGGAIASMLQGDLPNDFDIYFYNPEIAKKVADYYLKDYLTEARVPEIESIIEGERVRIIVKSAGVLLGSDVDTLKGYRYFETLPKKELEQYLDRKRNKKGKYSPVHITSNAITLTDNVQLCLRFTGNPVVIHENYDFVHCTNVWSPMGLWLAPTALESILTKELRYVGSKYPICSMFRLRKFIQRGWTITAGEAFKIAWDIAALDLKNVEVLQEQLVGVDQAYFHEVISCLLKEKDVDINRTYLFEIVNRVFDNPDFEGTEND